MAKKLNAWEEVQSIVNRAKQTAGTLIKSPAGRVASQVGQAAVNTVNPTLGLAMRTAQSPQVRRAVPPIVNNYVKPAIDKVSNVKVPINMIAPAPFRPAINLIPTNMQPQITPRKTYNFAREGLVESIARPTAGLVLSARKQSFFNPQSSLQKFAFGKQPVRNIQGQGEEAVQGLKKLGINIPKQAGAPLVVAGLAANFLPGGGGKKKAVEKATHLAKKAGTLVEFLTELKKSEPEVQEFLSGIIKNKKIAINSFEDFYALVNRQAVEGIPSKRIVAPNLPRSGLETKVSPSLTSTLSPEAASKSMRYSLPSQAIKAGQSVDFTNPSSIQQYVSTAQRDSQANVKVFAEDLEKITGIKPNVRVKKTESMKGKIERYLLENKNPSEISDTLAGRIVVKSMQDIESQIQNISKNFKVVSVDDYFKNPTKWGYQGINAKVELPNGMLAEVQIHTPESLRVASVIHKTYEKWRNLDLNNLSATQIASMNKDLQFSRQYAEKNLNIPQLPIVSAGTEGTILKAGGGRFEIKDLNATDDVIKLIKQTAAENDPLINTARRGTVTFEDTRKAADALGTTVERLKNRPAGKAFNDAEIVRAGDILKTKFESLQSQQQAYKQALEAGTATEAQKLQMMSDIQEASLVMSKVLGAEAEAGRALNATKILKRVLDDPTEAKIRMIKKQLGARDDFDKILTKFNQLDFTNPEEAYKFLRSVNKSNFSDKLLEYWYNSILSSPSTHLINSISNSLVTLLSPVERLATAGVESIAAPLAGRPRQAFFGEAPAELVGMSRGIKEGVRKALEIMKKGYNMEDVAKLELRRPQSITVPVVGTAINVPSRMLVAADAFFKSVNYSAALQAEAYRIARSGGAKGKELARQMAETIANPPPILMEKAKKISSYRVFQQEPGEITKKFLALRNSKFKGVPALQFMFPFVQTPVNLVKFGVERTPLGFANVVGKQGVQRSEAIAKAMIGTSIAGAIGMYAWDGKISGAPPKDRVERDALYAQGWRPYSLKVGDKWVSYQRLEPFNQIFTQIALMKDSFVDNKELPTTEKVQRVALGIASNLTSQTYMSGISDILNAIEDPQRYGGDYLERQISGLVPASSLLRFGARVTDPTVREQKGVVDAVKSTIPGLSQQVPAKINEFGDPIVREGGALRQAFPIKYTTETGDAIETQRQYKEIRDINKASTAQSTETKSIAQKEYEAFKTMPREQKIERVRKLAKSNPTILKKIIELAKEDALGLTPIEKRVKSLGVVDGSRARYIKSELKKKQTKEEKRAYVIGLVKKKILTKDVLAQMTAGN